MIRALPLALALVVLPPMGPGPAAPPVPLTPPPAAPTPPEAPGTPTPDPAVGRICSDPTALTAAEVEILVTGAATAVDGDLAVVVVDRIGQPLVRFARGGFGPAELERALGLARTGAFFSNSQAPLSSRTVRFVSGIHFPPGVARTPNAALYGIELTNRGCDLAVPYAPGKDLPPARSLAGMDLDLPCDPFSDAGCGTGPVTGKLDLMDSNPGGRPATVPVDPGGLPVYAPGGGTLAGGIGVVHARPRAAEFAALAAVAGGPGFLPDLEALSPGVVFIDGIRLPFALQRRRPAGVGPGSPPPGPIGGGGGGGAVAGDCAPDGDLVPPRGGSALSQADVERIVAQSIDAARRTRAVIRLPLGSRARMVIAVADLDGSILALHRMADATVFSVDVAVAKARNVVYFSGAGAGDLPDVPAGTAINNRTLSFGGQPLYPAGIDGTAPGPFFDLFRQDAANPCSQGGQPANPNQNGIVWFPGSLPLYDATGNLVGGLGISGDGVEQDDYVSFLGAAGFRPPEARWADRVFVRGVRLPFLKFPRNPER
jgi:uncharacterized protein GlcG (DUF336 family)